MKNDRVAEGTTVHLEAVAAPCLRPNVNNGNPQARPGLNRLAPDVHRPLQLVPPASWQPKLPVPTRSLTERDGAFPVEPCPSDQDRPQNSSSGPRPRSSHSANRRARVGRGPSSGGCLGRPYRQGLSGLPPHLSSPARDQPLPECRECGLRMREDMPPGSHRRGQDPSFAALGRRRVSAVPSVRRWWRYNPHDEQDQQRPPCGGPCRTRLHLVLVPSVKDVRSALMVPRGDRADIARTLAR